MTKHARLATATVIAVVLLGFVTMLTLKVPNWKTSSISRGTANLIFNEPGSYASPSGLQSVEIWAGDDGLLHLRVQDKNGSSTMSGFSPDSDWMMCWDENDQLWFYNPEEGPAYCRVFYVGPNVRGSRTCGEGGGWQGIPEVFLNQLPEEARATYRLAQRHQANHEMNRASGTTDFRP